MPRSYQRLGEASDRNTRSSYGSATTPESPPTEKPTRHSSESVHRSDPITIAYPKLPSLEKSTYARGALPARQVRTESTLPQMLMSHGPRYHYTTATTQASRATAGAAARDPFGPPLKIKRSSERVAFPAWHGFVEEMSRRQGHHDHAGSSTRRPSLSLLSPRQPKVALKLEIPSKHTRTRHQGDNEYPFANEADASDDCAIDSDSEADSDVDSDSSSEWVSTSRVSTKQLMDLTEPGKKDACKHGNLLTCSKCRSEERLLKSSLSRMPDKGHSKPVKQKQVKFDGVLPIYKRPPEQALGM